MKTKVLKYDLAGRSQVFVVSLLALLRKTGLAGEETSGAIPAEVLDTLKIQLVSPNVTGAQMLTTKLTRPCHYSVEGNELTIALGELTPGQHRLTVKSVYGTNTRSLLIIDATVPVGAGETGEAISVDVAAVSTVSDENNADGRVFNVDDEGNARINAETLSIGGGTATGEGAVAEGGNTTASGDFSHAEGYNTTASGYQSHAEGESTTASGNRSHAEGENTTAGGDDSHAEGYNTTASGEASHAEGNGTRAIGDFSHAEGRAEWGDPYEVTVRPLTAQEKQEITAKVGNVHPDYISENDEIDNGQAPVLYADEECTEMVARIKWSKYSDEWHDDLSGDFFQIMSGTLAAGTYWARFEPVASGNDSHTEGHNTTASGEASHAEGDSTTASGYASHTEGYNTTASGYASHAEGESSTASGDQSHAEGNNTTASGYQSHAEGENTTASGNRSHAEGNGTRATGENSHAEGFAEWGDPYEVTVRPLTAQEKAEIAAKVGNVHPDYICEDDEIEDGQAPVLYADEECTEEVARIKWSKYADTWHDDLSGDFFQIMSGTLAAGTYWARFEPAASGYQSHAEGNNTTASGNRSHAEGENTTASGYRSHAEGSETTASGYQSHAEGENTTASGDRSHAEGLETIAAGDNQHVSGKYNVEDSDGDYALIVGNGAGDSARSNAFAIDWNGNLVLFNNGTPVVLTPAKLAQLIA